MLWVQGFVDFRVLAVGVLDSLLLVDEGLGEFLGIELLVVDDCVTLAIKLLVAQILLIDINYLR